MADNKKISELTQRALMPDDQQAMYKEKGKIRTFSSGAVQML